MAKPKRKRYVSPAGRAKWTHLAKPDKPDFGKGKESKPNYNITLVFTQEEFTKVYPAGKLGKDHEGGSFKDLLDRLATEAYEQAVAENPKKKKSIKHRVAYKEEVDEDGNETGHVEVRFKQNAFFKNKAGEIVDVKPPQVFDKAGRPLTEVVYGGSLCQVAFGSRYFLVDASSEAVNTMDLQAVRVIELVTGGQSAEGYGFDVEKDDEADEDEAEETGAEDDDF